MSYILVTGGAGYIGSHTVIELIKNNYKVVIVDNLVNSSYDAVARIEFIVKQSIPFFNVDIRDHNELSKVFQSYPISGVIHFAALKAVGESTKIPLDYYDNNINGTINLLNVMKKHQVKTIVFSSSATVYGDATRFPNMIPIPEHCPNDPTNPYGKTKYVIEQILKDLYQLDKFWRTAILRYFNPMGAHPSGLIGEDPLGIPNNLLPYLAQVAIGRREKLSVFGNDYNSHDGTPIRDYIHVVDLARGHIAALNYLKKIDSNSGLYREWNLGTGKGSTVFDVYNAFCKAVGRELPYEVAPRRDGDVLDLTANPTRANTELNWKAQLTIEDACKDLWNWTTANPFGFKIDNYTWSKFADYENRLHTIKINDFEVSVMNYGAAIQNISINGQRLVNGFTNPEDYKLSNNPLFGATVGRYANRISKGEFSLDGKAFKLPTNDGINTSHGGEKGFNKKNWLGPVAQRIDDKKVSLQFLLVDEDGSNGFPAEVETIVKYVVGESGLEIEFEATISESSQHDATPINLTNHTYFNLDNSSSINGTQLKLSTSEYLAADNSNPQLPNGEFLSIESTDVTLTQDVSFDNCFVVDKLASTLDSRNKPYKTLVKASKPDLPITLEVSSTEPAFQLYTGDFTNVKDFKSRSGFCVEAARFTNAINHKNWASQVTLHRGETYGSKIKYSFQN